jgi:hypothetical protein
VTEHRRIVFSRHAADMIDERQIERAWVEETIFNPEIVEPDPYRLGVMRALRRISERGDRHLRVAYVEAEDTIKVVTLFLDRGKKRRN